MSETRDSSIVNLTVKKEDSLELSQIHDQNARQETLKSNSTKMEILSLASGFPPELSTGRILYELFQELSLRGHKVIAVTPFPRKLWVREQIRRSGTKFFYWENLGGLWILRCWPQFRSESLGARGFENIIAPLSVFAGGLLMRNKKILHCQSPPLFLAFTATILKKLGGVPLVLRIQDLHPDALVKMGILRNRLMIWLLEMVEKFVYLKADHITVISEGCRTHVLSKGVAGQKVSLIPNWVDTKRIVPSSGTEDDNLLSFRHKFVVTYGGLMSWPQDLETAIKAAQLLEGKGDVVLLLVGDGVKREGLWKLAHNLGLDNVVFMPLQPHKTYLKILQASDAGLVSLRKGHTSPTIPSKIMEIMASGKPVIANVPLDSDVHKMINQAQCGVWVESENPGELARAILMLRDRPTIARSLGENGRKFVEANCALQVCVDEYESILSSLLANPKPATSTDS